MKILVIGGGGREHALAWKLAESPKATKVYVAPGNGGTALAGGKLENLNITDVKALREWARAEKIAVTVVGPEAPLAAGSVVGRVEIWQDGAKIGESALVAAASAERDRPWWPWAAVIAGGSTVVLMGRRRRPRRRRYGQ